THARTDRAYGARRLGAEGEWALDLVKSFAQIDVDEVDPGGLDVDQQLARLGRRIGNVVDLENLRAARLMRTNRFHCFTTHVSTIHDPRSTLLQHPFRDRLQ